MPANVKKLFPPKVSAPIPSSWVAGQELYLIESEPIGCDLYQSYYRPATPAEIAERAGTRELNEALELAIKRIHALEKELNEINSNLE
jgi:hypothetical protein